MRLSLGPCLIQDLLAVEGGGTQSIFPVLETLLHDRLYQESVRFMGLHKKIFKYRSLVDFWFSETIGFEKSRVFKFYKGKAPYLRYVFNIETIIHYEEYMIRYLLAARELQKQKCHLRWNEFLFLKGDFLILPQKGSHPLGDNIELLYPRIEKADSIERKIRNANRWEDNFSKGNE